MLNLEESKQQAITTVEGPLLIIAGPGSGKTLTLVERIIHILTAGYAQPNNLFVSTFTEKAAQELITRVSNRLIELNLNFNLNEIYIGTLHSIFLRLLEENREYTRLSKNYRVLDDFDQRYLIYDNLSKFEEIIGTAKIFNSDKISSWDKAEIILYYINKISEEDLDTYQLSQSENGAIVALGNCFHKYREFLIAENCLDFSTIQLETLNLLREQPTVLSAMQRIIKYIMVDEYQDTNTIQEKILMLLTNPETNNICVVGDDDQGLYRFRGATIRNILEFPQNFKNNSCTQIKLTTNYRSHPGIISLYNNWMNQISWTDGTLQFRYTKTIEPNTDENFEKYKSAIKVSSQESEDGWHQEIFSFINFLRENSLIDDLNQIAFLFRSVKSDRVIALAEILEDQGISIFSPRSALLFEREEIKLMVGALVFIFPLLFDDLKYRSDHSLEIWDYYQGCKTLFAEELRKDPIANRELIVWIKIKSKTHLEFSKNTDYSFATLFYQLLEFPIFSKYISSNLVGNIIAQRASYNLGIFSQLLTKFEYLKNIVVFTPQNYVRILREFFNKYLRFLIDGGIEEFEDYDDFAPSGCVSFMTIHQSKGLEFPIVIVDSLNSVPRNNYTDLDIELENNYYSKKSFEPINRIKEFDFWRLYYTAFSRPQNLLVLSGNESKGRGLKKLPSKYLESVYKNLTSWRSETEELLGVKFKKVKSPNIKKEYSFTSDISVYETCPLQYKYYKTLEFSPVRTGATMFGILVHQTIEDIHKNILKGDNSKVTDENISAWFNANYNSLVTSQHTFLREEQKQVALQQVINYKKRHENNWQIIKEAEVDVSLVKDKYILKGTIDLIRGENDTVEIVDFKSEKNKPDVNSTEDAEKLNRYQRQLQLYAHIVEERTDQKVSKMHLYYTGEENSSPYITFDREGIDIGKTILEFDNVIQKIESKDFNNSHIKKTEQLCGNCDMRFYCKGC